MSRNESNAYLNLKRFSVLRIVNIKQKYLNISCPEGFVEDLTKKKGSRPKLKCIWKSPTNHIRTHGTWEPQPKLCHISFCSDKRTHSMLMRETLYTNLKMARIRWKKIVDEKDRYGISWKVSTKKSPIQNYLVFQYINALCNCRCQSNLMRRKQTWIR